MCDVALLVESWLRAALGQRAARRLCVYHLLVIGYYILYYSARLHIHIFHTHDVCWLLGHIYVNLYVRMKKVVYYTQLRAE